MQLIEQRKSGLWKWLLAPVILLAGVFFIIGWAMYMMIMAATQEEPKTESADYVGTGGMGMVYTITPIGEKEIPKDFLPIYKAAGAKYGVPWNLLAAHHFVETRFSSEKNMTSPVGAVGHMQFMKKTWI